MKATRHKLISEMGEGHPIAAPKAQNKKAQGNALGKESQKIIEP